MSVLALTVGQKYDGPMTFTLAPPPDGAVSSDTPAVCPITMDADHFTIHMGPAVAGVGAPPWIVTMTYTGTSVPPDSGPCVVTPCVVTVTPAAVAEGGDFNPSGGVIS